MEIQKTSGALRRASQMAWFAALLLFSVISTRIISWRVPGLDLQARNWLIRTRGPLPVPNDIVIVAIDETSLARFGRYPWRRSLMGQLVSRLAEAHPKAIALDVLFSETTSVGDDTALTTAIAKAGNVITAAQLIRTNDGRIHWLRPLPPIEKAAAAVGHAQVSTDVDGVAGSFLVREADDEGQAEWAMALETICVGEGASHCPAHDVPGAVVIGARTIPVRTETHTMEIESGHPQSMQLLNASWIPIEYAGPSGSFSSYTFSFGDVLDGRVNASAIREKYVIVGATAAALGDRFSSPFVHLEGPAGQQNGEFMPGTEVLANSLNTVLRQRFYSETPEWLAIACAALVALMALAGLSLAQGKHEILRQAGMIVVLAGLIVSLNYIAFARWLVFPPLVSCSVSLIGAVPLILFHRSLVASRELDNQIEKMVSAESRLWPSAGAAKADPAELVAHLTGAVGAAILSRMPSGRYRLAASSGIPLLPSLKKMDQLLLVISAGSDNQNTGSSTAAVPEDQVGRLFYEKQDPRAQQVAALKCFLGNGATPQGVLVLLHHVERNVPPERLRIGVELANGFLTAIEAGAAVKAEGRESRRWEFWRRLPRGITWKTRELGALNYRLLSNSRFVDQSLRSVGDGLLVGGTAGQVVFFNRRAAEILGMGERSLLGSDLLQRLGITEPVAVKTLERLYVDRVAVEREVSFGESSPRHYILRLSPVLEGEKERCAVVGVVASMSEITKQRELQRMKTEVMALVTHELRTPITAIQGMSEVLAQFDVETERRREMNAAINDEAKRLAQMIDEYLDITYLEASARQLRKTPLRVDTLVERVLLLLNPWATSRGIRLTSGFDPELPVVLADSELLARAVTNLVANAVKYSQSGREVRVSVRASGHELLIVVADRGYGISAEDLKHIFEKFYRVQRAENAGEPGTGLGLALVHEIMTSHGGRIDVESELGAGSTFTLRLPLFSKENQALKQSPDN